MKTENLEEYMELFYALNQRGDPIRTKTVAEEMGTTKGNVSQALSKLKKRGLIDYEPYGEISLTPGGRKIGREINLKHTTTEKFLIEFLNVPPKRAHDEACKLEHALSSDTISKLTSFMGVSE